MALATAATGIGKQVVAHAVRTWLGARRERDQREAELIELVRIGVRDHFKQRKLVRQLEDLADQIAERLRPVYEHDFRNVPENERAAALQAVVDALDAEFRARYLAHVSGTLDELEQFGIDVRRYKPRTLVSVAYLSLQVSTDRRRPSAGGCGVCSPSTRSCGRW